MYEANKTACVYASFVFELTGNFFSSDTLVCTLVKQFFVSYHVNVRHFPWCNFHLSPKCFTNYWAASLLCAIQCQMESIHKPWHEIDTIPWKRFDYHNDIGIFIWHNVTKDIEFFHITRLQIWLLFKWNVIVDLNITT